MVQSRVQSPSMRSRDRSDMLPHTASRSATARQRSEREEASERKTPVLDSSFSCEARESTRSLALSTTSGEIAVAPAGPPPPPALSRPAAEARPVAAGPAGASRDPWVRAPIENADAPDRRTAAAAPATTARLMRICILAAQKNRIAR